MRLFHHYFWRFRVLRVFCLVGFFCLFFKFHTTTRRVVVQIQRYLSVTLRMAFKEVRVLQWPYLDKPFNLYSALPALLRSKNVTLPLTSHNP